MYDPDNPVIKLCAEGMEHEGMNNHPQAKLCFQSAWDSAGNDFEKSIAAHYLARQQPELKLKLEWDLMALFHARRSQHPDIQKNFPSLYLNIAKCYEDMGAWAEAARYYHSALDASNILADDGYSQMIRNGIRKGQERIQKNPGQKI